MTTIRLTIMDGQDTLQYAYELSPHETEEMVTCHILPYMYKSITKVIKERRNPPEESLNRVKPNPIHGYVNPESTQNLKNPFVWMK
jgi:hypothetical protein